ncbi:MAG: AsnC family transcriptional regulator [Sandaracinus sp.]|nr:AsnC family transcriptional regulator [Sandaracinus sp.]|tara:strand:+ start:569 stop:1078 length:510 start_codon:yes stop_codon:yes gene_type:complete
MGDETYPLDAIDTRLLQELQHDAKISLKNVGERVGLSAPAVMERLRKMEQSGVIRGYHAQVDARKVGLDVAAFIGVAIGDPKHLRAFETYVDETTEILECHHVTGGHTLLLKVRARNTAALEKLISSIRALEGVDGTETMVILSTRTERIPLPLEVPDEDPPRRRRKRA